MNFLVILGLVLMFVGNAWLIVLAFEESLLWGIGALCVSFVGLIFAFSRWGIAKQPFLIMVVGAILAFLGVVFGAAAPRAGA